MHNRQAEDISTLHKQFVDAVYNSIVEHCTNVLEKVPSEEIDAVSEEDLVLFLSVLVLEDVMDMGLHIMCWKRVTETVEKLVAIAIVEQKRCMNGEDNGEKASTL